MRLSQSLILWTFGLFVGGFLCYMHAVSPLMATQRYERLNKSRGESFLSPAHARAIAENGLKWPPDEWLARTTHHELQLLRDAIEDVSRTGGRPAVPMESVLRQLAPFDRLKQTMKRWNPYLGILLPFAIVSVCAFGATLGRRRPTSGAVGP
jgi:hypothetical protein